QLVKLIEPGWTPRRARGQGTADFHDLLKALAMDDDMHLQLVLPWTYGARPARARGGGPRMIQDEATRAWNLHAALYYKAKGLPWRLVRDSSRLTTCFVGVSFYKSRDDFSLMTSMAQVF